MAREYVWKKKDGFSQPIGLTKLQVVAASKVVTGRGPFDITMDGDLLVANKTRLVTLSTHKQAISHREIGQTFRIRAENGKVLFTSRAVDAMDDVSDANSTSGNENADIFWNWVKATYPQFHPRYAGAYVCKSISGSGGTASQHSFGNAVDVFFDSITHQEVVWNDIRLGKCPVPVAHAISLRHIWSPSGGVDPYSGDPHYHLHVDFLPQYSGSCGVRGPQ